MTAEARRAAILDTLAHAQHPVSATTLAKALANDELRKIEPRDVAIRFAIKDGRITTQPFDLKMGGVNINLSGSTGLDQTIDYKARVAVPGGKTLQSVGVNIGGTFSSPKITLGVREAAEEAVKNVVNEQIQKLTGSESLSEEIARQAENLRTEAKRAGEKLIAAAQKEHADYAVDIYPYYGSDVEATLRAGYDIRHGLIGAGVYASHGYERSHRDGVLNTLRVLRGYLF